MAAGLLFEAAIRLLEGSMESALKAVEESWTPRERGVKSPVVVGENSGGPASAARPRESPL